MEKEIKSFTERLDDLQDEARIFIEQKTKSMLTDINNFVKFSQELFIEEGIVMGLSINKDEEISAVLLDENVDEISFINIEFLRIEEMITIAEELQSGSISIESLDSI